MKTAKRWIAAAAVAAALGVAGGCASQQRSNEVPFYPGERPGEVTMYRDLQFEDIPVPVEYTMLRDRSHSFQGSRFRTAVLIYEGPLDSGMALSFYRDEMPKSGWALDSFHRDYNFVDMRYRKGPEQLIVVVRSTVFGSRTEMQLDNIEKNDLLLKGRLKPSQ